MLKGYASIAYHKNQNEKSIHYIKEKEIYEKITLRNKFCSSHHLTL